MSFLPIYLWWHYTQALRELISNIRVFINFILRFFSISSLFKTIFSPWERMNEGYKKGLNVSQWAETFVVNTVLRILGFCIKTVTIFIGLMALGGVFVLSAIVFVSWVLMPFIWVLFLLGIFSTII